MTRKKKEGKRAVFIDVSGGLRKDVQSPEIVPRSDTNHFLRLAGDQTSLFPSRLNSVTHRVCQLISASRTASDID